MNEPSPPRASSTGSPDDVSVLLQELVAVRTVSTPRNAGSLDFSMVTATVTQRVESRRNWQRWPAISKT